MPAVIFMVLGSLAAACGSGARTGSAAHAVGASPVVASSVPTTAPGNGSLGDAPTSRACHLLRAAEIEAQFGGPVGAPTPIYPYCQWVVGDGTGFVALTILPTTMDEDRRIYTVRTDVPGLGDDAYISSSRALVFGVGDASYSILWQEVGDFTTVATDQLRALAERVLARV